MAYHGGSRSLGAISRFYVFNLYDYTLGHDPMTTSFP